MRLKGRVAVVTGGSQGIGEALAKRYAAEGAKVAILNRNEAKALAVDGLYDTDALRVALPFLIDHIEEAWRVFGKDFWAYGLESNRSTWGAIGRFVYEQGLAPRVVTPEELFPVPVE